MFLKTYHSFNFVWFFLLQNLVCLSVEYLGKSNHCFATYYEEHQLLNSQIVKRKKRTNQNYLKQFDQFDAKFGRSSIIIEDCGFRDFGPNSR